MSRISHSPGQTLLMYLQSLSGDGETEFFRESLRVMLQLLMELEVSALIAAEPYERKGARQSYRNGYRERRLRTGLGEIELKIPKLRKGTYYPSFIDDLPTVETILLALIQDACVQGVNAQNVETVLRRLGLAAAQPSQVAEIGAQLDDLIYEFRQRPLNAAYDRLGLERVDLETANRRLALVVAVGQHPNGQREILGFEVTPHADERIFWMDFLRNLKRRGLEQVEQVMTGETYEGLLPAVREVFGAAVWKPERRKVFYGLDTPTLVSAVSTLHLEADRPLVGVSVVPKAELALTRLTGLVLLAVQAAWSQEWFSLSQPTAMFELS
ncbi:MAG TPA: transposase [Phototrophicaceae bacterium]|nr:transposase [Phototrophicaceae bacterium]